MTRPIDYLFAYGTLSPRLAPPGLAADLSQLTPLGRGWVQGRLYDLGAYPAAVPDAGGKATVAGTVFRLPERGDLLARLDAYEGPEFRRIPCQARLSDGTRLRCWIYAFGGDLRQAQPIAAGEWPTPESDEPPRDESAGNRV